MTLALLTLLACTKDEPADSGDDTGVEGDTDTDTDTDSDTDTDVGTPLTYAIGGDIEGVLNLTHFEFEAETAGDLFDSVEVSSDTQEIKVGIPLPEQLAEIDPENLPGLYAAFYIATVETDDGITQVAPTITVFLDGDIPPQLGWDAGWNALEFTADEELPTNIGVDAIPVNPLEGNDSITLGGTSSVDADRWLMVPSVMFEGLPVDAFLADEALGEAWSLTVSGPPPDDHFGQEDFVFEVPLAYVDNNESGAFNDGDSPVSPACTPDGKTALLIYLPNPTDPLSAWYSTLEGQPTLGWVVLAAAENEADNELLSEEAASQLAFDGTCSLE